MSLPRVLVVLAFVLVLALPFAVRPSGRGDAAPADGSVSLIIVTPHVGQIRDEYSRGFARWYAREYPGQAPVFIDWRVPGGTSEIVKQFKAEYEAATKAAARDGTLGVLSWSDDHTSCEVTLPARSMGADLMFGGGHYEHGQLRSGVTLRLTLEGKEVTALTRISEPAGFEASRLLGGPGSWFTENKIGNQELFEQDQYWIGAALSAFGIVYNRELVHEHGLPEPRAFRDLTDFRYARGLALADARQSGSVATTYESILNKEGWDGWRTLRELGANARSFASASTKPPVDVSQGDAVAGLAIDFYGRAQAQAVLAPGEEPGEGRVGYVDPRGAVYVDADPISVLRGCPNPELARRFIEFCMSDEGQALWQFPPTSTEAGRDNPPGPDGKPMGPERYSLRRMPVRQAMYTRYISHFVDQVNPFEIAAPLPDRRWRTPMVLMMGAFAVDTADDLRNAWEALHAARAGGDGAAHLAEMESLFYAFPRGADVKRLAVALFPGFEFPPDSLLDFTPEVTDAGEGGPNQKKADNCVRIAATWKQQDVKARLKIIYTEFFRENYRKVSALAHGARKGT